MILFLLGDRLRPVTREDIRSIQRMKLTGAAILVSRAMKVLQAAPAGHRDGREVGRRRVSWLVVLARRERDFRAGCRWRSRGRGRRGSSKGSISLPPTQGNCLRRRVAGQDAVADGEVPVTVVKMLCASPQTASRRKLKAERFCCLQV